MRNDFRVLFSGGGSTGHLAPSVAVWEALRAVSPEATALFLCSERPGDAAFLSLEKIEPRTMPMPRIGISLLWRLPSDIVRALGLLREFRPDVIFCKGGGLNVPVALAAKILCIPIVLHESDRVMGRANRFLSRFAKIICLGFPLLTTNYSLQTVITGNPIRRRVTKGSRDEGLHITGLSGRRPILLVIGGSQGAQSINDGVAALLPELLQVCDIAHVTGAGKMPAMMGEMNTQGKYWAAENASRELQHLYAIADIAVSRAGAGSISELAANHIPSILIPLRGLAQDHQEANARYAAQAGGCLILEQEDIPTRMAALIRELCSSTNKRKELQERIGALQQENSAEQIAQILLRTVKG